MPKYDRGTLLLSEMYEQYRSFTDKPVSFKTHKAILELWGNLVSEYIIAGKEIPLYVGFKVFGTKKIYKPTYVDRRQSKLQKKLVIMPNTHSDFYGVRMYWKKIGTKFNIRNWSFTPVRKLSRALAKEMQVPGGHRKYMEKARISGTAAKKQKKRFKL